MIDYSFEQKLVFPLVVSETNEAVSMIWEVKKFKMHIYCQKFCTLECRELKFSYFASSPKICCMHRMV